MVMETPTNGIKMNRLRNAVEASRKIMEPFRVRRLSALRQYTGKHWSPNGSDTRVPMNLIQLAIEIYTRQLVARNPAALVTVTDPNLQPKAKEFEIALNFLLGEIKLDTTLRMAVIESMFGLGIVKVGLGEGKPMLLDGNFHDAGQPFADYITLDDWVHDMNAARWDLVQFEGNRYTIPLEDLKGSGLYDQGMVAKIKNPGMRRNEQGDEKASAMSGNTSDRHDYYDMIELWDLWLPREKKVVTICAHEHGLADKPLRVVDWEGPEHGPFHKLGLGDVPGNTMPLPPVASWRDIHDLTNILFNKLGRQATRQKDVTLYRDDDDAERIRNAGDGEMVQCNAPEGIHQLQSGGINQQNLAFSIQLRDFFSYFAGNLDAIGGLSPQASTLGQDELLSAAANQRVADMQDRVVQFVTGVVESLGVYLWENPAINLPLVKPVQNESGETIAEVDFTYEGGNAAEDFIAYNVQIQPFSMQHQTPSSKLQGILSVMERLVFPLLPQLQQEGKKVNLEGLLDAVARYGNLDEMRNLVTMMDGSPAIQEQSVNVPGAAQAPRKETIRRSIPGGSRSGSDQVLVNNLLGSRMQPDEEAAAVRPAVG